MTAAASHIPSPPSPTPELPAQFPNRTEYVQSLSCQLFPSTGEKGGGYSPLKIDEISPEWLLILIKVFLSAAKTSSSTIFVLASCAASVSLNTGSHRGSCSLKPSSKVQSGNRSWIAARVLRRSHVCTPMASRKSSLIWGAKGRSAGSERLEKVKEAVCRQRVSGLV